MKRPNILFILSDDQGAWALGSSGNTEIITPNLDRLANVGIRFDNFFCASPVCSPARASILTGTPPSRHGILDWLNGGNLSGGLKEMEGFYGYEYETVPIQYTEGLTAYTDLLKENGYNCELSGKWHIGDSLTPRHGFRSFTTIGRGGCGYYNADIFKDGKPEFVHSYITDYIADDAMSRLNELALLDMPFYLSVHFTAPHSPWDEKEHPEEILALYKDCEFDSVPNSPISKRQVTTCPVGTGEKRKELLRGYYGAITAMDRQIGRLIERLEELGIREDTIIIFTSDNGMNMGHHGLWGKGNATYPQNMYDTSIKVPFIISWKEKLPEHRVCHKIMSHYDIFPTLQGMLKLDGNVVQELPGRDFSEMMLDDEYDDASVVILDEYGPVRMIRNKKWKLVIRAGDMENELYDMENDTDEERNLYGDLQYTGIIEELTEKLEAWYQRYGDRRIEKMTESCKGTGQFGSIAEYEKNKPCFGSEPKGVI